MDIELTKEVDTIDPKTKLPKKEQMVMTVTKAQYEAMPEAEKNSYKVVAPEKKKANDSTN